MNRSSFFLLAWTLTGGLAAAQAVPSPATPGMAPLKPLTGAAPTPSPLPPVPPQSPLDRLTQSNRELIDLLKKQQAVLEDIQYDRRLQSRQIQSLVERLTEAQQENGVMQKRIGNLEATVASQTANPAPPISPPTPTPPATNSTATASTPVPDAPPAPAAPPFTYLPPATEGVPGSKAWRRLFTISGTDGKNSDLFSIQGRRWRVLWHNLDKPGKAYQNTSALFIHAYPKDDTIPQQVCSKLGTGGDQTELEGPGNFYLKVEASGGSWELAVEDFR